LSRQTSLAVTARTVKPVPRREKPDPYSEQIGKRIRELRVEQGITMERLAYESELGSKGHLSNIERGLVRPTAHTLKVLADALGVLPLYLLTFPADGARQQLVERTRHLDAQTLRRWLSETDEAARERKRKPRG
jgi:transcriptional regulator with XRE-family HTH domain